MKKKPFYMVDRPLADTHLDGVQFDPKINQALVNQCALRDAETESDNP